MRIYLFTFLFSLCFLSLGFGQVVPTSDLSVTKTISPAPYFPNNLVSFTIIVRNNGPDAATGVVLTDILPPTLTLKSAAANSGIYVSATGTLALERLSSGATATLTLTAQINAPAGTAIANTAAVTGTNPDPAPGNNTATVQFTVSPVTAPNADLMLDKVISPGPYQAGDNVTYTLTVANRSTITATNVTVTDLLPQGLTFVQASGASYNAGTGVFQVGDLAGETSVTLSLIATINTSGPLVNIAHVAGSPVDPDNTNNTDTVRTCVLPAQPGRLEINNSEVNRNICAGQDFEFKVPVVSGATAYTYTFLRDGVPSPDFTVVSDLQSIKRIRVSPQAAGGAVTVEVRAQNNCGPGAALSVPLTVSVLPPVPEPITGPIAPCSGAPVTYSIPVVPGATAYSWTLPAGWVVISGASATAITVRPGTTAGDVIVKAGNACGGGSTRSLAVTPVLTPATPVIADSSNACAGLRYTVAPVTGATAYEWTVPQGWTIEAGQGTNTISVKAPDANAQGTVSVIARNGSCPGAPATYQANASRGNGVLDFPNAFSPNGDGQNETYIIGNLDKFPDNDILIINRWGNQVFKEVGYQNNWSAKDLNDGTYFYVLRVKACNNEQKIFRGYITVAR